MHFQQMCAIHRTDHTLISAFAESKASGFEDLTLLADDAPLVFVAAAD
jgi:hypothetical protein